jgi:hypothetical protein
MFDFHTTYSKLFGFPANVDMEVEEIYPSTAKSCDGISKELGNSQIA